MIRYTLIISILVPTYMYGMHKGPVPKLRTLCRDALVKIKQSQKIADLDKLPDLIKNPIKALENERWNTTIKNLQKQIIGTKDNGTCFCFVGNHLHVMKNGKCRKKTMKDIRSNKKVPLVQSSQNLKKEKFTNAQKAIMILHHCYQQRLNKEQIAEIETIPHEPLRKYMTTVVGRA